MQKKSKTNEKIQKKFLKKKKLITLHASGTTYRIYYSAEMSTVFRKSRNLTKLLQWRRNTDNAAVCRYINANSDIRFKYSWFKPESLLKVLNQIFIYFPKMIQI